VQVRRAIQGDNTILEQWAHSDTALGWSAVQGDPGFKADPVAFQQVECLHAGGLDTPVILQDWGAIVQTDLNQADETLGSLRAIVEAELTHNGAQSHTRASELMDDTVHGG
jgi:hypothetical protein